MTLSDPHLLQLQDLLDNIALRTVGVGEHANPISADQYWRDLREAGHAAFHLRDIEVETLTKEKAEAIFNQNRNATNAVRACEAYQKQINILAHENIRIAAEKKLAETVLTALQSAQEEK